MNRIGESCESCKRSKRRRKRSSKRKKSEEIEENRARVCTSRRAVEMRRATFEILTTGILKKKRTTKKSRE